ncbi:MAG: hypothetical protein ABI379_02315 [Rhodanobacter sp.]
MQDSAAKSGHGAEENTHKILNQAMFDAAHSSNVRRSTLVSTH